MAWLKWHVGGASDPKFRIVAKHAKVKISDAIAVWMIILEYAFEHDGFIDGVTREIIEVVLNIRPRKIDAIFAAMNELSTLSGDMVTNWEERQALPERLAFNDKKPMSNAERQRRHREKTQGEDNNRNGDVTKRNETCNGDVTERNEARNEARNEDVTACNEGVTERNESRNESVTKCNAPFKEKIKIKEEEEDIKNPPTPQGGIGGENAGAKTSLANNGAREKKPSGNSLPELREAMRRYTGSPPLLETLEEFRMMRERIRKPMTGRALQLLFGELDKLSGNRESDKIAILNQSILNSWQGVFPLKNSDDCRASPKAFYRQPGEMSLAQRNYQTGLAVLAQMEKEEMERAV